MTLRVRWSLRWYGQPATRLWAGSRWFGFSPALSALTLRYTCLVTCSSLRLITSTPIRTTTATIELGPSRPPLGDETRPKPYAIAGDLVLVSKLAAAETSDTLSNKAQPALVEPWLLPEPLLPVALHASTPGDEEKLGSALQRLVAEDVTMRLEHNPETHQLVIWAMGPAHVDKLLTALRDSWHIQVQVEPVRTSSARPLSVPSPRRAGSSNNPAATASTRCA